MRVPWAEIALLLFNLARDEERKKMVQQVLMSIWRESSGILGAIVNGIVRVIKTGVSERVEVAFTVLGRVVGLGVDIRILSTNGGPGSGAPPAPAGGVVG